MDKKEQGEQKAAPKKGPYQIPGAALPAGPAGPAAPTRSLLARPFEAPAPGSTGTPIEPSLMGMPSDVQAKLGLGVAAPTPTLKPMPEKVPYKWEIPGYTPGGEEVAQLPAAVAEAPAQPMAPGAQAVAQFKESEPFRKAGWADIIEAASSGWIGKQSQYAQDRAEFQARIAAAQEKADAEARQLALMAREYEMRGEMEKAQAAREAEAQRRTFAFQASENAKNRPGNLEKLLAALQGGG